MLSKLGNMRSPSDGYYTRRVDFAQITGSYLIGFSDNIENLRERTRGARFEKIRDVDRKPNQITRLLYKKMGLNAKVVSENLRVQ